MIEGVGAVSDEEAVEFASNALQSAASIWRIVQVIKQDKVGLVKALTDLAHAAHAFFEYRRETEVDRRVPIAILGLMKPIKTRLRVKFDKQEIRWGCWMPLLWASFWYRGQMPQSFWICSTPI